MQWSHLSSTFLLIIFISLTAYLTFTYIDTGTVIHTSPSELNFYRNVSCEPIDEDLQDAFFSCGTSTCGRSVSDVIISKGEVNLLIRIARRYFPMSFISPGAYISSLNLEDDADHLLPDEAAFLRLIGSRIAVMIGRRFRLQHDTLIRTQPTIFYRVHKKKLGDEDNTWYVRSGKFLLKNSHTFKAVILLSNHNTDHTGGRFWIGRPFETDILESRPGRVIAFSLSKENKNIIDAIEEGSFLSLSYFYTCNQDNKKQKLMQR